MPRGVNQGKEGPEELTLRTEEVGSPKRVHQVYHIAEDRWGPPLVDADWHTFCKAIYKGLEGRDWEKLYEHYKEMSGAAGGSKEAKCKSKNESPLENEGGKRQWIGFS